MDANNQSLSKLFPFGIAVIRANESFPFESRVAKIKDHTNRQAGDPEVIEHLTSFMISNSGDHLGIYNDLSELDSFNIITINKSVFNADCSKAGRSIKAEASGLHGQISPFIRVHSCPFAVVLSSVSCPL